MSSIDLSIIIVSWNVGDLLLDCLESIYQITSQPMMIEDDAMTLEIIIVDSASSDNTVQQVKELFPQVILIPMTENIGYTRGNNLAMAQAKGRHIFLLNPDTLVLGNALVKMVQYLDANPDVGIIGPFTLNTDGTTQPTRRRFPTPLLGYFESTWLQPFSPKRLLDHYYVNDQPSVATIDVDWVQGSALMARREVYERIGGLDEGYIMFSEELDWCKRAKLAGWRVVFLCTAQIIHHGGQSTSQVMARKHIHFQESKLRYFHKYHGNHTANTLRRFLLLNYYFQIIVESLKSLLGHKRELRQQRIREYRQVIKSGLKVT